ncbi:MAG: long-chain fatty acid transporter, partial [Sulfurovum sp.]|nr:outer membrane protein transport protein [Sulfurovum sp.]NNJ44782.1 long-chain fatty acid transporter [Sulfurovum sp.]
EQSLDSMALSGANVAYTTGADTNYDNPANMSFLDESKSYVEGGITLVHLPSNVYTLIDPFSGESEAEDIPIPFLHYVSKPIGDFRWGLSMVVPGGLTKRWETPFQKASVEDFTLKIIELNPSMSYKIADNFSIGGGLRLIYSEGVVKSDATAALGAGAPVRDMEGDTVEFGYNLAMTYKPTSDINLAVTYRSKIDLDEEGTADLSGFGETPYSGDASVSVPLPAALNLAMSKTWNDKFTLEFNYERTFWSAYETLDFSYSEDLGGLLGATFDTPIPKNWKDTNTFRVGATIEMDNKITAMMGFAIDESPVPVETLGFETPDTDAKIFSMGFRYQQNENLSWGAAFLYDSKEPVSIAPETTITNNFVLENGGSFSGGGAFLTTVGIAYEY